MSVAMAAPFMPMSSAKMNMGSRMMLTPAPINMDTIALTGYPHARMMLLKLNVTFIMSMPGRRYSMRSFA